MNSKSAYIGDLDDKQIQFLKSAGFPTFDEFQKNPDKYRDTAETILECIDRGPEILRNATAGKHKIYVCGKKVATLEQASRVAKDMGFDLKKMEFKVNLENVGNGKYIHHVDLVPKREFREGAQGS